MGINLSTMSLKSKGVDTNPKTLVGIHFGEEFEIPLNDNIAFRPGLILSSKGSNYKNDTTDFSISPIYLEIPVNLVFSIGSDMVKVTLFAGSYFAWGVGGYKIEPGGDFKYLSFGAGDKRDLKPVDIGLNFGMGVNIKGFLIAAKYGKGIINISPVKSVDSEMKNNVIGISVSSSFIGK
jgi:hypothetical protein